jgi:hypothetical protein
MAPSEMNWRVEVFRKPAVASLLTLKLPGGSGPSAGEP